MKTLISTLLIISLFDLSGQESVRLNNKSSTDYEATMKSPGFTHLMWDRNSDGNLFSSANRPAFFYWDNDDLQFGYLIDTRNMEKLNAQFNSLEVLGSIEASEFLINGSPISISTPWNSSGSNIYFSEGQIGIGTSSPLSKLHVVGQLRVDGNFLIDGGIQNSQVFGILSYETQGAESGLDVIRIGIDDSNEFDMEFWTPGVGGSALTINNNGNIAIGDFRNPKSMLSIGGPGEPGSFSVSGRNIANYHIANFRDWQGENLFQVDGAAGDESIDIKMGDIDEIAGGNHFVINSNDSYFMNGRVGIGTDDPSRNLHVIGSILTTENGIEVGYPFGGTSVNLKYYNQDFAGLFEHDQPIAAIDWGQNEFIYADGKLTYDSQSMLFKIRGNINLEDIYGEPIIKTSGSAYTNDLNIKIGDPDWVVDGNHLNITQSNSYFLNGNVGIGTSNPQYDLHVNGTINANQILVNGHALNPHLVDDDFGITGDVTIGGNLGVFTASSIGLMYFDQGNHGQQDHFFGLHSEAHDGWLFQSFPHLNYFEYGDGAIRTYSSGTVNFGSNFSFSSTGLFKMTNGDIEVTDGNIEVTDGNIEVPNGEVIADQISGNRGAINLDNNWNVSLSSNQHFFIGIGQDSPGNGGGQFAIGRYATDPSDQAWETDFLIQYGNVGIGMAYSDYLTNKLEVNGKVKFYNTLTVDGLIRSEEVLVQVIDG
ncbi:MAG: hypothetical protein RIF46_15790, partial [Cyclobacteriaceae bacterium]